MQFGSVRGARKVFLAKERGGGATEDLVALDDASFDCAVITWTLCTIPDPSAALREVRRVLKPGAELFFVEHGKAPDPGVVKWQDRLNKVWPSIAGGCNLNRKMDQIIADAGFRIDELETSYRPGLKPMTYFYMGVARPA